MRKFIQYRLLVPAMLCGSLTTFVGEVLANENCAGINEYPNWTAKDWAGGEYNHASGGDQMVYQNSLYEAKWHTNTVPGSDASWIFLGGCSAPSSSSSSSSGSSSSGAGLPSGWLSQDVGEVEIVGLVTPNGDGAISMSASGKDIGHDADKFHFLYTPLQGDGEITAYIESVNGPSDWTKIGVMLREDLDADAANSAFLIRPEYGSVSQIRPTKAFGITESSWEEEPPRGDDSTFDNLINFVDKYPTPYRQRYLKPGKWLKVMRKEDAVLTYSSDDGLCWNLRVRHDVDWNETTYAGVALSSHVDDQIATATIRDLSVSHAPMQDVNENCERSKVDGQIAEPEENDWVVRPGVFGGGSWSISFDNPNPSLVRPVSCREDVHPARRRDSDDDAQCPADVSQAPWMRVGYSFNTGDWQHLNTGGFGNRGRGRAEYTHTAFNKNTFWLRREVELSQDDIDQMVFWGRWSNSVSIFVNGVFATGTYDNNFQEAYHYLGVNPAARNALVVGTNVIAARVECAGCENAFADFGIARHNKLGNYPIHNTVETGSSQSKNTKLAKLFLDYTQEMGVMGGSLAIMDNGVIKESHSLGWKDITLSESIPERPVLRLASVGKGIIKAAAEHLYAQGKLNPESKVFGASGLLSHVQPRPGAGWGDGVLDITVGELYDHKSGIYNSGWNNQAWKDHAAYMFDTHASELNKHHLIRILASEDTKDRGTKNYSSNGYALLAYVIEHVAKVSLEEFVTNDMGGQDIVLSYERLADRNAQERTTGYQTIAKETRSRWFELEDYQATSASAEGLIRFFHDNQFGVGGGGGSDGVRSVAVNEIHKNSSDEIVRTRSYAYIWNSDIPPSNRFEDKRVMFEHDVNPGSCDPRGKPDQRFRLESDYHFNEFFHIEPDSDDNKSLQFSPVQKMGKNLEAGEVDPGWNSVKWHFEPKVINGETYYVISNALDRDWVLHTIPHEPEDSKPVQASSFSKDDAHAHWVLHDEITHFRLESRAYEGYFLNVESRNEPRLNQYHGGYGSVKWLLCN